MDFLKITYLQSIPVHLLFIKNIPFWNNFIGFFFIHKIASTNFVKMPIRPSQERSKIAIVLNLFMPTV